jgi:putative sterol carrier protein
MAWHDSTHFDALKKLCDVVDYLADKHFKSWQFCGREFVNLEFYYPVLVLQGELFEARAVDGKLELHTGDHLQFRRSKASRADSTDYQIDIVKEAALERYLDIVERELERTARRLKKRDKIVRKAIKRIVARAKDMKSLKAVKEVMSFD